MPDSRQLAMDFDTLSALRRTHSAWRLLAADHAPFAAGFLHRTFIAPNTRTLAHGDLCARLDDYLFELRSRGATFPKSAAQYLEDWASDKSGWLRKYYPAGADEPCFDLTPATEKALDWLASLQRRQFIGTESRLRTVFELLRQMTAGTEEDPEMRLAALERKRADLDAEIQEVRGGRLVLMDPTQVKDRFLQMEATARALLSDFREVEQNFRLLDRALRERIATWEGGKGALLQQVLGERDAINDSDQGRSFRAFWDFLMSPATQEALSSMLQAVFELPAVQELQPDPRLLRIHYDWLEAGELTQATVRKLSAQLRRYLDDEARLENRRIVHLLREIEQQALALRPAPPHGTFMELDEPAPDVTLTMERPLFSAPFKPRIVMHSLVEGAPDLTADALFRQVFVDKERLAGHVRRALQTRPRVSLGEVVEANPLQLGLAELVAYLSLAAEDRDAVIDDHRQELVVWLDARSERRQAAVPLVIFCQAPPGPAGRAPAGSNP